MDGVNTELSDIERSRLLAVIFPRAHKVTREYRENQHRFVQYTTAENAIKIISGGELWLRNATTMNDYSEIRYGLDALARAYRDHPAGQELRHEIEDRFPGICERIESVFGGHTPEFIFNTFVACFSEHDNTEDMHGRLSMWRAYGRGNGVAIVFKGAPFFSESDALKAYAFPVLYGDVASVAGELASITARVRENDDLIERVTQDEFFAWLFTAFRFSAICTKHPGFLEEREWRVVYNPGLESSPHMQLKVEVIGGIPQQVAKLPLSNIPSKGLYGVEIPEIIDRLIIGPTQFSDVLRDALIRELAAAGVAGAETKVVISGIPLRG